MFLRVQSWGPRIRSLNWIAHIEAEDRHTLSWKNRWPQLESWTCRRVRISKTQVFEAFSTLITETGIDSQYRPTSSPVLKSDSNANSDSSTITFFYTTHMATPNHNEGVRRTSEFSFSNSQFKNQYFTRLNYHRAFFKKYPRYNYSKYEIPKV